jgi:hypothetical protein
VEQLEGLNDKERGFTSFSCAGMRRNESLLVGTVARIINLEGHYTCFRSECPWIHVYS